MHIYRWDLDKTYIETEFGSVRAILRTALEPAIKKRNTPGSAALLRALIAHDSDCRVAILSGSPTQMRKVLEQKLAMDGIRFDSLTLKNNLGNLRRGRLRAVKGQLGYKLPVLLQQRAATQATATETLFGDDAEVDALIYAVYADAITGNIDPAQLTQILERGGAYPDDIQHAVTAMRNVPRGDAVEDIFIRLDANSPVGRFESLGNKVVPVFSWLQAAMVLWRRSRLDQTALVTVIESCVRAGNLVPVQVAGLIQDAVRRRLVPVESVHTLLETESALASFAPTALRALHLLGDPPPRSPNIAPDFAAFLDGST
jgi:hypothetical protein